MKYDPDVGIFGMDVAIVFQRAGSRVRHRRIRPTAIGRRQRVTREDAIGLMREKFGAEVL
jgi:large subunit ribosomal protein L5